MPIEIFKYYIFYLIIEEEKIGNFIKSFPHFWLKILVLKVKMYNVIEFLIHLE